MAFLLRNSKKSTSGNGRTRQDSGATADTRILPRPRSTLNRRNQSQQLLQRQSKQALFSGSQILVQRSRQQLQKQQNAPTNNQQQVDIQSQLNLTAKKQREAQQQQQQQQQQETPGVISMSEVLEDLRVLEQQQREAQQKLANARLTKEHRQQQYTALESTLEQLKYSNGELRAQLRQSRETLSCGTRELGTRRLVAGRAGDDIRSFERKLKKGLRSVRMVTACRRKIDSLIIVVKNKKASLLRLKAEAKGKLSLYEKDMREVQLHEQTLRTTIQQEVARSQTFAEELAAIRAENTELEQEMLQAQNVEESTRLREASIEAQIESDRKRHDEVVTQSAAQIDDYQNVGNKVTSEQEVLAQHLEEKTKELLAAKRQIKKKLEEEGHNASPITVDLEGPVPRFDRKRFEKAVEAEYNEVRAKTEVNGALRQLIEELRESLRNTKEETFRSQATASTLSDSVHAKKATETERRVGLESFENKLERDRAEVSRLVKSSKDLEDIRAEATSRHLQLVSECSAVIRNDQRLIETVKRDLEIKSNETERKNVSWEKGKSELSSRVEKAKRRAEITGEALDNYKKKADEREVENTKNFQETIRQIEESRKSHEEKSTRQISKLTKKYPDLEKLEFVYDKSKSRKEQAELVLESLLSEFEAKIASAKESREAKLKQRREARRQAEAAAAEVKRKEEERHKNRERLQAEIQEGRQMGKKRLKSQMHCRQEDAAENRRSRRRKPRRRATESGLPRKQEELEEASCGDLSGEEGIETTGKRPSEFAICNKANRTRGYGKSSRHGADFFLPQSREAFAEEDTPTHPKRLLPAFASVDNPVPSMTLASISQNSDRRVHWEDQGDNDDPLVDRVPQKTNEDIGSKTKYDTGASQPTNTMHRRYASGENKGPGDPKLENDHSDGLQGQEPELYPTQERVHSPTSVSRKKKQSDSSKKDSAILNSMRIAPTSQNTKALSPRKGQVHNSSEKKNLQSKYKQVRRTELGLNKLQEGKELEKNDNVHVSSKKRNKLPAEPSRSRERNSRDNLTEPKLSLSKLLQKNWHKGKPRSKAMEGRDTAAIYDSSEILFYHVKKDEKDPLWLSRKSGGASDSGDDLRKFKDGKEGSKQKADRGKANESKSSLRKKSDQKSSGDHRPHKKITKVSGTSDGLQASRKTSPSTKGTGLVSKTRIGNLNKQRNPSKESRVKRKSFDRGSLDSLAAPKQSLGASKRTKRTSSTPRKLGPSSHQESSKGIIASKSRTTTKRPSATRKRKSSDISCTQSLGQSSCEGGSKARRRKKKEATGSQKSSTKSLADDAYDFHF